MSRIPLVSIGEMTAEQRAQYDRFPSNLTRGLLLTEQRLAAALPNTANALRTSGLDPKLREGVILRVAALSDSPFERMQHLAEAKKAGWSDAEIRDIEAGDPAGRLGAFGPILRFEPARRGNAGARDCHYMAVARFIAVLGIELDPAPSAWDKEH